MAQQPWESREGVFSWLASTVAAAGNISVSDALAPPASDPAAPPGDAGGAPPPGGAGSGAPGQPPFGSSPVSQPTPDHGNQAAALGLVAVMLKIAEMAIPKVGSTSPIGKELMQFVMKLGKHVPQGAGSPGQEKTTLQQLQTQGQQNAPMMALLKAQQPPQGGPPGAPPPAAGAA